MFPIVDWKTAWILEQLVPIAAGAILVNAGATGKLPCLDGAIQDAIARRFNNSRLFTSFKLEKIMMGCLFYDSIMDWITI